MDSRGSITTEIALVLIIVVLIAGTLLTAFENSTEKVVTMQERQNMKTMSSQLVDNLINNPGVPDNWHEYGSGTPGLAVQNEGNETIPNSVSYGKFIALGGNYKKLIYEKYFNSKIESSMELIPLESTISSVKIGSEKTSDNIYSANRLVKCDFFKKYVINDFQIEGKCNHNHDPEKTSCNYFKIFKGNVKKSNYYLLIDDGENVKYILDTTRVVKERYWQSPPSDVIYLNDEINFYDDTSAVVFIHLDKPKAKAVLISVPKGFDREKLDYDYFKTNECELVFRAWWD